MNSKVETENSRAQVIGLFRTAILSGFLFLVYYAVALGLLTVPETMYSWIIGHAVNPLFHEWINTMLQGAWQRSLLSDHWLFQWAPDVNAQAIFLWIEHLFLGTIVVYLALIFFLGPVQLCEALTRSDYGKEPSTRANKRLPKTADGPGLAGEAQRGIWHGV